MLNLTDEQKAMFYSSGYYKGYRMVFDDIDLTIDNEIIHQESVTITQSICSDEELSLGGCIASSIEFEVSEVMDKDVTGLEFKCYMDVEDAEGGAVLTIPMGVYRVDSANMVDDKDYKKIIAYDALYDASEDVSEFYNNIFAENETISYAEFRLKILNHFGIEFEGRNYINDNELAKKTLSPQGNLTGVMILKCICEANGAFGYIDRNGKFSEAIAREAAGLFPEEDLFPAEDLYPESGANIQYAGTETDQAQYISTKFEEYETMPITCVTIKSSADDIGVASSDDESNPYIISSNFLFYGKSKEELKSIGKGIQSVLSGFVYRPNETTLEGLPYMDVGDWYSLVKNRDSVVSPVLSRTLTGVQGLRDTFYSKGNKIRANEQTTRDELIQNMGKSLEIQKSIDGLSVDVIDLGKKEQSHFEQTSNTIVLKVDKNGRMVQVELGTNADDGNNYFKITSDSIDLTAEDIINLIAGNEINLSTKKITITADNLSIDEDGNVTASGMELTNSRITSPNFSVDEDGHVMAKSMDISGGSINLSTSKDPSALIELSNYDVTAKINGETVDIKFFGEGRPKDVSVSGGTVELDSPPQIGDYYFNLSASEVFQFKLGNGAHWVDVTDDLDSVPDVEWTDTEMNTENGFSTTKYKTVYLDDNSGNGSKSAYQNGDETKVSYDGIRLKKTVYTTKMGTPTQQEIESKIHVEENGYDASLNPMSIVKIDSAVSVDGDLSVNGSVNADGDGVFQGDMACGGTMSGNSLVINGSQLICGSIIKELSSNSTVLIISAPGVDQTMPASMCNGDLESADFEIGTVAIAPTNQTISAVISSKTLATIRVNYSYWKKL